MTTTFLVAVSNMLEHAPVTTISASATGARVALDTHAVNRFQDRIEE